MNGKYITSLINNIVAKAYVGVHPEDDCEHDEFDHDTCINCGYERDPGEAIDAAMDYADMER